MREPFIPRYSLRYRRRYRGSYTRENDTVRAHLWATFLRDWLQWERGRRPFPDRVWLSRERSEYGGPWEKVVEAWGVDGIRQLAMHAVVDILTG